MGVSFPGGFDPTSGSEFSPPGGFLFGAVLRNIFPLPLRERVAAARLTGEGLLAASSVASAPSSGVSRHLLPRGEKEGLKEK